MFPTGLAALIFEFVEELEPAHLGHREAGEAALPRNPPEAQGWQVVVPVPAVLLLAMPRLNSAHYSQELPNISCNAQLSPCSFGNNSESLKGSSLLYHNVVARLLGE